MNRIEVLMEYKYMQKYLKALTTLSARVMFMHSVNQVLPLLTQPCVGMKLSYVHSSPNLIKNNKAYMVMFNKVMVLYACKHRSCITESVDSLHRGGVDEQYMQYLSKIHIIPPQLCTSFYITVEN